MKKRFSIILLVVLITTSAFYFIKANRLSSSAVVISSDLSVVNNSNSGNSQYYDVDVSMIQLIANPEKFHKRKVRLIGFVRLEFEGNAVYFHQDDYKHGISSNALWITTNDTIEKEKKKYDQKYVLIQGVFNARDHGHLGLFSGAIEKIERFEVWGN